MTLCVLGALATVAAVVVQIALPGKALYHYGWYNVAVAAGAAISVAATRGPLRHAKPSMRRAIAAIIFGCLTTAVAGSVSGLFGPENQRIVGSPGQRVPVEGLGTLIFPMAIAHARDDAAVQLQRPFRTTPVSPRPSDFGSFIANTTMRTVVEVEVSDAHGNHLTVTQPTGRSFLSPVLLMERRQTIAGFDVPYDSFNVPVEHRVVKAVLFSAAQAAMFGRDGEGEPAVLFAVDDENDRPLAHGIGFDIAGRSVRVAGLQLRATVADYPAVEVVSAPNLIATVVGTILVLGASAFIALQRRRARYE